MAKVPVKVAPFKICRTQCGWRPVEVWAMPDLRGGNYTMEVDRDPSTRIEIGMDERNIREAWGTLVHEAMELILSDECVRFKKTDLFEPNCSDSFWFIFNHNQFTEACAKLGWFLYNAAPEFNKAYKTCYDAKWRKKKLTKRK